MPGRHQSLPLPASEATSVLPHGNGRSYGDSNLNPGGALILGRSLDRFIELDPTSGLLTCEAGVLLSEILRLVVPQGWFLPVTPGTQFVTVGGAVANDVHGKNHHLVGSFGNHVVQFELLRSDGSRRICSPTQNPQWFAATIGGLGLTGMVTWVQLRLRRIANPCLQTESIRFRNLQEFFDLSQSSEADFEYTVSWIDCAASGAQLGRGLFNRANHAPAVLDQGLPVAVLKGSAETARKVPVTPPWSLVNQLSLKAFNWAYYHRQVGDHVASLQHYRPFFYPLDALLEWNRIYGPKGFYQYQCVVPTEGAIEGVRRLLSTIARSGTGSFLAVLKQFGTPASLGMLSFPMPGLTLALDFPNQGPASHALFRELDSIVQDFGGRIYAAKDACMSPALFKSGYPQWSAFSTFVDPRFSSGFWRRVMEIA